MSELEYSKGPWRADDGSIGVFASDETFVCEIGCDEATGKEAAANRQLIAAAPQMHEALMKVLVCNDISDYITDEYSDVLESIGTLLSQLENKSHEQDGPGSRQIKKVKAPNEAGIVDCE